MILELALKGPIGPAGPISLAAVREKLASAACFTAIHFTIESKGGDFDESFAIFTALRALPLPVAATAMGECLSGALIIFMAAGLRKAKAGTEFLIHPASRGRDQLPERVTAETLQKQADELAKIDERVVELFADRTLFDRRFFEDEKATEEPLGAAAAVHAGIVHEIEGLTPSCDPAWPELMRGQPSHVIIPQWMKTAGYLEACRFARFFERHPTVKTGSVAPQAATPRLTVVAN